MTTSTREQAQPKGRRTRGRPSCDTVVGPDALLRHGRRAFARHGFDATSVRGIARDAGVDPSLVMHYFGSKEALWTAIIEQIAMLTRPMIEAIHRLRSSDLTSRQRVETALALLIDQVFAEPDIGTFFSTAIVERGERVDFLIDRLVRPYRDAMVPLLSEAIDEGACRRNDPDVMFMMLSNAVSRTISHKHVLAAFSSLPQRPAEFKAEVLRVALTMLN